jgi:predicted cobalt transporter CbtA
MGNSDIALVRTFVHYFLHFVFPVFIALFFYRKTWKKTYLILLATMLVDLDHLFADPVFDPDRASVGFHFLHSYYAIAVYFLMLFFKGNIRIVAIGLLFHMLTDLQDFYCWSH